MSLQHGILAPEPGYAQPVDPADAADGCVGDYPADRLSKRHPRFVVVSHQQPPCEGGDHAPESVVSARQGIRDSRLVVVPAHVFSEEPMQNIADELERMVKCAAGTITAGMSIKAQINAACDNLGYKRGHWRVRQAWYGDAKNWRSRDFFDMLNRYNRYVARQSHSKSFVNKSDEARSA